MVRPSWKTKEKIRQIVWEARQAGVDDCKKDLARALSMDSDTSWSHLIEIATLYTKTIQYQNEKLEGDHG